MGAVDAEGIQVVVVEDNDDVLVVVFVAVAAVVKVAGLAGAWNGIIDMDACDCSGIGGGGGREATCVESCV